MVVWEYAGVNYFLSKTSDVEDDRNKVTLDQRFKCKAGPQNHVQCNPAHDYFVSNSSELLTTVNEALLQLEQKTKGIAIKQEKSEYFFIE